jgi:hypothetical protein
VEHSPRGSSLFQASSFYGNVKINLQYAAIDEFGAYASAFHRASQALAEKMFASAGYNDLDACPIVFLYRHALELSLKAIALTGIKIMQLKGDVPQESGFLLKTHRLLPLLPLLRRTFDTVGWKWDLEIDELCTFEDVERLLQELEDVDSGSYTFRYPVNTNEHPAVPHHFTLHLPTFCHRMDALLDGLEAATMGLEITYVRLIEAAYNAQCDEKSTNEV